MGKGTNNVPLPFRFIVKASEVENLRFSSFSIKFHLLFPFSTLDILLYAYRVEERKFLLKISSPEKPRSHTPSFAAFLGISRGL